MAKSTMKKVRITVDAERRAAQRALSQSPRAIQLTPGQRKAILGRNGHRSAK